MLGSKLGTSGESFIGGRLDTKEKFDALDREPSCDVAASKALE
jgi:hypothetical protein